MRLFLGRKLLVGGRANRFKGHDKQEIHATEKGKQTKD